MVNTERLIRLIRDLIRIDSQNPPGNESRIAGFVGNYLRKSGLKVKNYEFKNKRSNVVAVLGGPGKKHSLLLTPHLDTVPAGKSWRFDPFAGKISGGKIYGLGATDCKANIACALEAIKSIVEEKIKLSYNLVFAATADEECGSELGLIPLLNKAILKPDAAVILDADDFDIVVAQKGLIHLKVKIQGRKAHGAYPWQGRNAIEIAAKVIGGLKRFKFSYTRNDYLRAPTINTGTIRGGDKVNVVADWCEFELDFRFLPGDSAKEILRKLGLIVRRYTQKFKIEIEGIQKPYLIDRKHPLVECLLKSALKYKPASRIRGSEGATVITFFQDKNIPAVATGFGSPGCAHTADEYVKIGNLRKGALLLEEFIKSYSFSAV